MESLVHAQGVIHTYHEETDHQLIMKGLLLIKLTEVVVKVGQVLFVKIAELKQDV